MQKKKKKKRSEVESLPNTTKPIIFPVERLNINPALIFISSNNNMKSFSNSFASNILPLSIRFLIILGLKIDPVEVNPVYLGNVDWYGSCRNPEDLIKLYVPKLKHLIGLKEKQSRIYKY